MEAVEDWSCCSAGSSSWGPEQSLQSTHNHVALDIDHGSSTSSTSISVDRGWLKRSRSRKGARLYYSGGLGGDHGWEREQGRFHGTMNHEPTISLTSNSRSDVDSDGGWMG